MEKHKRKTGEKRRNQTGQRRCQRGEKKIIVMTRSKGGEIRQKEGKHTGEGERNRMRKRNPKWKKSEEGKEKSGGRNGSEIRRQRGKRNPAKVRLASRERNSQVPEAPTPIHGSPGGSKRYLQSNKTVFPF